VDQNDEEHIEAVDPHGIHHKYDAGSRPSATSVKIGRQFCEIRTESCKDEPA
jgi:hypothetical protein